MIKVQTLETEKQNYAECVNSERHASYHHLLGHPVLTQHGNNTLPPHPVLAQHGNSTLPYHNVLHNTATPKVHHPTLFWHNMATAHYPITMFYTTQQPPKFTTTPCSGTTWQQHITLSQCFTQHSNPQSSPPHPVLAQHGNSTLPYHNVLHNMATAHYPITMFYTTWQQHIITPPCSGTNWQKHISTPSHFTRHDNTAPIPWTLKSKNQPIHPVSCGMATTQTTQCCDPK